MLENLIEIFSSRYDWFFSLFLQHISLAGTSILLAGTIGLGLGIFIDQYEKASQLVLGVTNMLYTIPDIAMFGFLIPFTGIGKKTAIIALTVYALLPMVRNTYTGLHTVDQAVIEAAIGMGSTNLQVLWKIKLPMAFSTILAGLRTMVVLTISLAGIAAYIGAGGLGTPIYRGIATNNPALIFAGSIMIAALAIIMDFLFGVLERKVKGRWKFH